MRTTQREQAYLRMLQGIVDRRIVELYSEGLTVAEIHEAMTPWGDIHPSPVTGIINHVITRATARGLVSVNE